MVNQSLNFKWATGLIVGTSILVWVVILFLKGIDVPSSWEAIKEVPSVVGWLSPLFIFFVKWGWRFPIFKGWLVVVALIIIVITVMVWLN